MVQYLDKNSGFNMWNANRNAEQKKSPISGFFRWTLIFICAWWLIGVFMTPKTQTVTDTDVKPEMDLSAVPTTTITSDKVNATVQGLRISNVQLADFTVSPDTQSPVTLLSADGNYVESGLLATGTSAPVATTVWKAGDNNTYTWRNNDGVVFTRSIKADGYVITIVDTIENRSKHDISVAPYARIIRDNDMKSASGVANGAIAYVNTDVEEVPIQSEKELLMIYTCWPINNLGHATERYVVYANLVK